MSTVVQAPEKDERAHPMEIAAQDRSKHRQVADIQRARILAAMVKICRERSATELAIAHVVARARVSQRTFYDGVLSTSCSRTARVA